MPRKLETDSITTCKDTGHACLPQAAMPLCHSSWGPGSSTPSCYLATASIAGCFGMHAMTL
jgi:hypothetical protein